MFKNYLKSAWRNIRKEKGFSAINIVGLAVGLATCLLITLFVLDEMGYDKFNEHADRIFRVHSDIKVNGNGFSGVYTPYPLGPAMVKDYPGIAQAVRLCDPGDLLVKKGDETIQEHRSVFADSTFFEVFSFPLIAGNPHTALVEPHSIALSESMAKKYFPDPAHALDQKLLINNTDIYKVTAIYKDMPSRSHLHFDFIRALSEEGQSRNPQWLGNNPATYLLAKPGVTAKDIDRMLDASVIKYIGPQLQILLHNSLADLNKSGSYFRYTAMPLAQIHLHSNLQGEFEPNGNIQYLYIFIIIAVFILLVACVNFMNLSTARSAGRSKEVGVRKVLGSLRSSLISQFLVESVLTTLFAMLLALGFAALLLPYFDELAGKQISIAQLFSGWMIPTLSLVAIIVGLLAGSYPAFFMSAFQPIQVLKGKLSAGFKNSWLRNTLVVFQFVTAIALIIGTLVIYSQLNYARHKELGYNRQQVLTIDNTYSLSEHAKTFRDEMRQLPGITGATMTAHLPNRQNDESDGYSKEANMTSTNIVVLSRSQIDADYVPTLGMKIVKGRNFSPDLKTDSSCILINYSAAIMLGYPDPIGKTLYTIGGPANTPLPYRIIGVIKDFNGSSLRQKIDPSVFHLAEQRGAISFRIDTKDIPALIAQIKQRYNAVPNMAGQPFLFSFMDDEFNKLYQSDERTGKIFVSFAIFAILIACLGLFGLVTYAAEQRVKEIGIRKVLGASVGNLIGLLSKDFLKLVAISALIAFPLAWWAMHQWLQDFVYRTNISWWVFVVAGLCALMITLVTVSFRAIRAALANPVQSLRSE